MSRVIRKTKLIVSLFLILAITASICIFADSAGSETQVSNGGYRAYLEYYCGSNSTTAGITRKTLVNVYLNQGETLLLGSSVYDSQLNEAGTASTGAVSGNDIVIYSPDGTATDFDVIQNGAGYIGTVAQESAGPIYDESNTTGFTPLSFVAPATGVYQIHYHSRTGVNSNPTAKLITAEWAQSNSTVAAWDATVLTADGTVKTGRTFTKCLALNMGGNRADGNYVQLNSQVYVVTNDGYIYKTDFNGMNPFGFIFFADNRGLVSIDSNYSLYRSYVSNNNLLSDLPAQNVTFQDPWNSDTELDKTFDIFFETPDPELENILYPTAFKPEIAKNLEFIGSEGNNKTHVGFGGYFKFDITNATSATITIDLTNVLLSDGTYADYGKVILSNPVTEGKNYFYWDGKGSDGTTIVPVGTYDNNSIKVSIETHSGEYHFPLFDVEMAAQGIKVSRVNKIYTEAVDENGKIYNEDVSSQFDSTKDYIYYNNAAQESDTNYQNPAKVIADSYDATDGIDSSGGAMAFGLSSGNYKGDQTSLDIWSYATTGQKVTILLSAPIIINDDTYTVVSGRVFFDSDRSAAWNLNAGDYAISGVNVRLDYSYVDAYGVQQNQSQTTQTGADGIYHFFGVPIMISGNQTSCTLTITRPMASYSVTTQTATTNNSLTLGTETQQVTLGGLDTDSNLIYSPYVDLSDVGYYYQRTTKSITVKKDWVTSISSDPSRPQSIDTTIQAYYLDSDNNKVETGRKTYTLNNSNNWQTSASDLPAYADAAETQSLYYRIYSETYTMRGTDGSTYTFTLGDSSTSLPYNTTFTSSEALTSTILTAVNAPKNGTIEIVKRDTDDNSILLSGVTFQLWKKTTLTEIPTEGSENYTTHNSAIYVKAGTKTTNENGVAVFDSLEINSYFVTETVAKTGYTLDTTPHDFTLSATTMNLSKTIYNKKLHSTVSIVKTVDTPLAGSTVPITLTYADNENFTGATTLNYTVTLESSKVSYTVASVELPINSYVKVTEGGCSYNLNSSSSSVYDNTADSVLLSTYTNSTPFTVQPSHTYTVTLNNEAQYIDTIYLQKLWLGSDGSLLDSDAYSTSGTAAIDTSAFNPVTFELQRSTDGTNWTAVTYRTNSQNTFTAVSAANDETISSQLTQVGSSSTDTMIWTKQLSSDYWHLPKFDNSGTAYSYRAVENATGNSDYLVFDGSVSYSTVLNADNRLETTATFTNPLTDAAMTYTPASQYGIYKNSFQNNMLLINYHKPASDYTMNVLKVDGTSNKALADAQFTLYSDSACTTALSSSTTALNGSGDAVASFTSLEAGTYYLKETKAPSGYQLSDDAVTIIIHKDGTVSVGGASAEVTNKTFSITVSDYLGLVFPQSGCIFPYIVYAASGVLVCCASIWFIVAFKKKYSYR